MEAEEKMFKLIEYGNKVWDDGHLAEILKVMIELLQYCSASQKSKSRLLVELLYIHFLPTLMTIIHAKDSDLQLYSTRIMTFLCSEYICDKLYPIIESSNLVGLLFSLFEDPTKVNNNQTVQLNLTSCLANIIAD